MRFFFAAVLSVLLLSSCHSQTFSNDLKVGGSCEGCEALYESPVPLNQLNEVDTLPDFNDAGPKLELSGVIYKRDGRTPAAGVILYIYHTDQTGHYPVKGNEKGWGKRHGYLRGWVKTNKDGFYKFFTLKPAGYPGRLDPAHIHATVKEPGKSEYYIDEFVFADDPRLANAKPIVSPRGGDGILTLRKENNNNYATRAIILGLNIPGYPLGKTNILRSGLAIGNDCPSFQPLHLSGPDKGSHICPMCKYGFGQGVMIWFNHDNLSQLKDFAILMEKEIKARGEKKLRVFLVYMNPSFEKNDANEEAILQQKIKEWCTEQHLTKTSMVWVPSPIDKESCGEFYINPAVKNTVLIYKKRVVVENLVDQSYDVRLVNKILGALGLI